MHSTQDKTVAPPQDPKSAIESRRKTCFGLAVVVYLEQNFPNVNTFLMKVRDDIIQIVDPERKPENCPRKLPELIKTKSLHASFYSSVPFIHQNDYFNFFAELNGDTFLKTIKEKLAEYLTKQEPTLEPVDLEFKEADGTILARYRVVTKDQDSRPLASLKQLLDKDSELSKTPIWDPHPLRDTTVAIALCVVDVRGDLQKIDRIKSVLDQAKENFKKLGSSSIENYSIIKEYDKRTLTKEKHVTIFSNVEKNQSNATVELKSL